MGCLIRGKELCGYECVGVEIGVKVWREGLDKKGENMVELGG